jgi:hypothetical protein
MVARTRIGDEPFRAMHLAALIDRLEMRAKNEGDEELAMLVRLVRVALVQSLLDRIAAEGEQ